MKIKKLYKGVFKLRRSIEVLHCQAVSEAKARVNFCMQIATKHNVNVATVLEHFKKGNENFVISEVEDEENSSR